MASSLDPIVTLSLVVGTIAALIFAGVLVALAAFTIRYRDRGSGTPPQIHGHQALEVAWTAVPVLALAVVFALSLVTLGQIGRGRGGGRGLAVHGVLVVSCRARAGDRRGDRARPHAPRLAPHHRRWRAGEHARRSSLVDRGPPALQAGRAHAARAPERRGPRRAGRVSGDPQVTATALVKRPRAFAAAGVLRTGDHKGIGILYVLLALAFLAIGGVEALLLRVQLASSGLRVLDPSTYDQLFTMHGITMIFLVAIPILVGFANYVVPLQIGAADVAFPRLNALSFWLTLFGGVLL